MTREAKRDSVVHPRFSKSERATLDAKAKSLGVPTSSLVRELAIIPIEAKQNPNNADMPEFVVFDEKSLTRLTHSINVYGSLYGQAERAIDTLSRHAAENGSDEASTLGYIIDQQDQIYTGVTLLEADASILIDKAVVYIDMTRKVKRESVVHARFTQSEKEELDAKARRLGVPTSSLIRAMANIPIEVKRDAEVISMPECIVFDGKSLSGITQTLDTYGSLYNQAVKALNSLAKHGLESDPDAAAHLNHVLMQLEQIHAGVMAVEEDAAHLIGKPLVYLQDADGRSSRW